MINRYPIASSPFDAYLPQAWSLLYHVTGRNLLRKSELFLLVERNNSSPAETKHPEDHQVAASKDTSLLLCSRLPESGLYSSQIRLLPALKVFKTTTSHNGRRHKSHQRKDTVQQGVGLCLLNT